MKKHSLLILSVLLAVILTGCPSPTEADLLFSTEHISDTNDLQLSYYTPDKSTTAKSYYLTANANGSELIIKCTNHNSIYFDVPYEHMTIDPSFQESEKGRWKAELISPNTVKFTFRKVNIKDQNITDKKYTEHVRLSSNINDEEKVTTIISVTRLLKSDEPLDFEIY